MKPKADNTPQTSLDLVRRILVKEMELDEDRVNIFNQNWKIPTYEGLFLLVELKGSPQIISNRNAQEIIDGEFTEVQMVNMKELVSISVMSRNQEAMRRKEEVLMAIASLYAQRVQEENGFRISNLTSIENLSVLEGSSMLTRFEVSLSVFSWVYKAKTADFYDSFTGEVNTEDVTVEFEQPVQ